MPFRHTTERELYASAVLAPSYATPMYMYGDSPVTCTAKYRRCRPRTFEPREEHQWDTYGERRTVRPSSETSTDRLDARASHECPCSGRVSIRQRCMEEDTCMSYEEEDTCWQGVYTQRLR